jgi:hypothetical protein
MRRADDPIVQLVADLERDGQASFQWMVRWSQAEGDPLAAAWRVSAAGDAMLRLLLRVYSDNLLYVRTGFRMDLRNTREIVQEDFVRGYLRSWLPDASGTYQGMRSLADEVRRVVPAPPPLAVFLAEAKPGAELDD